MAVAGSGAGLFLGELDGVGDFLLDFRIQSRHFCGRGFTVLSQPAWRKRGIGSFLRHCSTSARVR